MGAVTEGLPLGLMLGDVDGVALGLAVDGLALGDTDGDSVGAVVAPKVSFM